MSDKHHQLYIPKQIKPGKQHFSCKSKHIDQWFANLPLANTGESLKELYKTLYQVNRLHIAYKDRLYFLEKIRIPIKDLTVTLQKHYTNKDLPLGHKDYQIANLNRELQVELAIGYKHIVLALYSGSIFSKFTRNKLLTMVIHRTIRHLTLALLTSFQIYTTAPKGIWKDVHQLYLLAEKQGIEDKYIADQICTSDIKSSTTSTLYKQIVLLSIADPYRLAQHYIIQLYLLLEHWSQYCTLAPVASQSDRLLINLYIDSPPHYQTLNKQNKQALYHLDFSQLTLEYLLDDLKKRSKTIQLDTTTLKQIYSHWLNKPKRDHQRHAREYEPLKVAIGMNAVHYFLNDHKHPEWDDQQPDENAHPFNLIQTGNPDEMESNEIEYVFTPDSSIAAATTQRIDKNIQGSQWDKVYVQDSFSAAQKKQQQTKTKTVEKKIDTPTTDNTPYNANSWQLLNESVGGYCLLWEEKSAIEAKIGELIAISHNNQSSERKEQWLIGIIRWMKSSADKSLQVGIQIIAPHAKAITIQGEKKYHTTSRAIQLSAIATLKQPTTIITLPEYHSGEDIYINHKDKTEIIQLGDMLENTSHISRFHFKHTSVDIPAFNKPSLSSTHNKKKNIGMHHDFDNIWDSL